jgi:hypothetical protein
MDEDMIRQLPIGFALVIRGGLRPVIARLPVAWKDRTYKRARRAGTAIATLTAARPAVTGAQPATARLIPPESPRPWAPVPTGGGPREPEATPVGWNGHGRG